ncbi:MAG: hypothetical protein B6244_04715 [Candidatus Cloacimonetes bacterium 4572_55]|nr:MAG: hypothetical protein B6244_04715 [Candidatus Cloacimonetes bacterium 4572_55]
MHRIFLFFSLTSLVLALLTGCQRQDVSELRSQSVNSETTETEKPTPPDRTETEIKSEPEPTFQVISPAFEEDETVPVRYTCEGDNISPALSWSNVPDAAKELALICDDPDAPAGTWVHWIVFHIPPDTTGLPENFPLDEELPSGIRQGVTSFQTIGYGGPCPPRGRGVHHYLFKLYALDTELSLKPGATKEELLTAMEGHILAETQLIGEFERVDSGN